MRVQQVGWEALVAANHAYDQELDARYAQAFEAAPAPWLLAADALPEVERQASEQTARFMGSVAIRGCSEALPSPDTCNPNTLLAAIQEAALGDEASLATIRTNVATDVFERIFKAAHQTRIHMHMQGGKLQQTGRILTELHRNALEHTILNGEMLRRTTLELHNAHVFEALHAKGVLRDHHAVIFSPASTAMTQAEKKAYNFFVDTESCSIQLLTAEGNDITLDTAFVAGKATPDSGRHDIAAIHRLAREKGIRITSNDGTDIIGSVILIPKRQIAGVEDVVRWYDDAAGGLFYGQAVQRQDYQTYAQECIARGAQFDDMIESITSRLLSEAGNFRTPFDAMKRLDELSELYTVKRSIHDTSIDASVFGEVAARHIADARFFMQQGQFDRAEAALHSAQSTAISGSCPWLKAGAANQDSQSSSDGGWKMPEAGERKWMKCPNCPSKVLDDPCAVRLFCGDCTAEVAKGISVSKGNGGREKRRTALQEAIKAAFARPERSSSPKLQADAAASVSSSAAASRHPGLDPESKSTTEASMYIGSRIKSGMTTSASGMTTSASRVTATGMTATASRVTATGMTATASRVTATGMTATASRVTATGMTATASRVTAVGPAMTVAESSVTATEFAGATEGEFSMASGTPTLTRDKWKSLQTEAVHPSIRPPEKPVSHAGAVALAA